jgi:hypothetical protein
VGPRLGRGGVGIGVQGWRLRQGRGLCPPVASSTDGLPRRVPSCQIVNRATAPPRDMDRPTGAASQNPGWTPAMSMPVTISAGQHRSRRAPVVSRHRDDDRRFYSRVTASERWS